MFLEDYGEKPISCGNYFIAQPYFRLDLRDYRLVSNINGNPNIRTKSVYACIDWCFHIWFSGEDTKRKVWRVLSVNRLITDNCLHNKDHCQKKLNWNAEFHIPQVHIFNTHTERMFVKGPKISFLKKTCHMLSLGPWSAYWRKTLAKAASKRIHFKLKECYVFKNTSVSNTYSAYSKSNKNP